MRLFSVIFTSIVLLIAAFPGAAQEPWPVEQHCIGDLTYPIIQQGKWDFPGVIVSGYVGSSLRDSGVRAIRADIQTDYWLAMSSAHSFPFSGTLSPDNHYFAYPVGVSQVSDFSGLTQLLSVENIRIVRTDGNTSETYLFAGQDFAYTGAGLPGLEPVKWLSSSEVYYPYISDEGERLYDYTKEDYIFWTYDIHPRELEYIAPDVSRAFAFDSELGEYKDLIAYRLYNLDTEQQFDYPMPHKVVWFADSASFLAASESGLAIIDHNGEQIDFISEDAVASIALADNQQAFAFWDENQQLFIGNLNDRMIYDMCFETTQYIYSPYVGPNIAFSPDDTQLAFSYDGYLVILDLETLENQVIDSASDWVMGWGALEGEAVEISAND